ncbi:MAG TPA: VIT domain-containing protein [Longilinea sp.]|nr:VIT domain-containing protein [Longilinea sp.]
MKTPWLAVLLGMCLLLLVAVPVQADGIIIPTPPPCPMDGCPSVFPVSQLAVKYHHVDVKIENQIAVTHVDQVFFNPNDWQVEGTYLFPLPLDAVVTQFTLWIDGQPVHGQVLDAQQAREKYEEIVRTLRDPALLEYAGRGAVQASIFPIPPQGERRIELEYSQALTVDNGLVRYLYPLNTEKFSVQPLESVRVSVSIQSDQPIRTLYSPSHKVEIIRNGDNSATATYEASNLTPDTDFALYYSLGETEAFHLFSYRDPGDTTEKDGFFLLLLAPPPGMKSETVAKDVLLVLDRSGSMEGDKFTQAMAALRYILKNLNPQDRFYVSSFSSTIQAYASDLRPASEGEQALRWVDGLSALGSTDINRALLEAAAVAKGGRPTYLIFLTDGLPTEGEVDRQKILDNFMAAAPNNLRLFTFGVGYDVDTLLLDSLAQDHQGKTTYVLPGEPLEEALSGFYESISSPVLTNLKIDFGGQNVYDVYPQALPDLFAGGQIVVAGRYRDSGEFNLTLTGMVNGEEQTFRYNNQDFVADNHIETGPLVNLPRLWATRKIGALLTQTRLKGPDQESIDQIVRLSIRYGIVTPYTSYLVTEDMPLGEASQRDLADQSYQQLQAMPTAASGAGAVNKAAEEGALSAAQSAPALSEEDSQSVRLAGSRTFVLKDGIWYDTAFDPTKMVPKQIQFLSAEYFALADSQPDLGAALALGSRMVIVAQDQAYEVVASDQPVQPVAATNTPTLDVPDQTVQPSPTGITPTATTPPGDNPSSDSPILCTAFALPLLLVVFLASASKRKDS